MKSIAAVVVVVAVLALSVPSAVFGDVYMHNPRGSNDRNCERNVNRRNGNRLFDSQNNAKGGYACPRAVGGPEITTGRIYYFSNSKLPIEWTAQHGCGTNPKEHCEITIQFACEDTLDPFGEYRSGSHTGAPRDGTPRDDADDATDTIPATIDAATADTLANRRYGMHENIDFYNKCRQRSRNRGLFTADQKVRRNDARGTRQNPNGNRRGLECPEERDYYPYWHPTPWRDVAVITSNDKRCDFYKANSGNVMTYGACFPITTDANGNELPTRVTQVANLKNQGKWYNNKAMCEANGHKWEGWRYGAPRFDTEDPKPQAPACEQGSFGRINHLGNVQSSTVPDPKSAAGVADLTAIPHRNNANRFIWTIPTKPKTSTQQEWDNCVVRLRYNISTGDYPAWDDNGAPLYNSSFNNLPPIKQDPYITIGPDPEQDFVSLALNTNQYGRTFQDRSYVFAIKPDPRTDAQKDAGKVVYNLNVRGKRGNIVQTYPAVEYDFVPNDLNVNKGDLIHFQWTGSDYNPRRGCNDAEGGPPDPNAASAARHNSRADRSNIIEVEGMDHNIPRDITKAEALQGKTMFVASDGTTPDMDTVFKMAHLNQKATLAGTGRRCLTQEELEAIGNKNQRENHPLNCAKMNAAYTPYFDGGLVTMNAKKGPYYYYSSRNNNFSNRDQTGRICIDSAAECGDFDGTSPVTLTNAIAASGIELSQAQDIADAILAEETFQFDAKDNDAFGDGEAEDCEAMRFSIPGVSVGGAVAIAFSMLAVGAGAVLGVQYGVRRYKAKQAALLNDEDSKPLRGSSSKRRRAPPPPRPRRDGPPPPVPPRKV